MLEHSTDSVPLNLFAPENRENFCDWIMREDTVTPGGRFIKYLISNDSCCWNNLYIQWGNAQFRQTAALPWLRRFHPKMTPMYVGESEQFLFMKSAASGGLPVVGWYLWLFPVAAGSKPEAYETIAPEACDLQSLTIVREVEKDRTDRYFLEAYNIRTHRVKPIRLKNRMLTADPSWAIDSVSVTPRTIFLRIEVYDEHDEMVHETLVLPNDIK